ncbi:hypothetical protein V1511DRAFT_249953 [Dipodascopsis uninucleata]
MGLFDLEDQLTFYNSYHHNQVNVWIHTVCVPLILVCSFAALTNTGPLFILGKWYDIYANFGVIISIVYAVFYVLLDPVMGTVMMPFVIGSSIIGTNMVLEYGSYANSIITIILIISWAAQFIGHGVFEKRAPALLDNLFQALFLAPFFVCFELVFKCGFRLDLQDRLEIRVQKELEKLQAEQTTRKTTRETTTPRAVANKNSKSDVSPVGSTPLTRSAAREEPPSPPVTRRTTRKTK